MTLEFLGWDDSDRDHRHSSYHEGVFAERMTLWAPLGKSAHDFTTPDKDDDSNVRARRENGGKW